MAQRRRSIALHRLADALGGAFPPSLVVEDLAEAFAQQRHRVHSPHRHDYIEIFILNAGAAQVEVETTKFHIHAPAICIFPQGTVHAWGALHDATGYVLRVSSNAAEQWPSQDGDTVLPLDPRVVPLPAEAAQRLNKVAEWLEAESKSSNFLPDPVVTAQLRLFFAEVNRLVRPPKYPDGVQPDLLLVARFRQLVDVHYSEGWTAEDYAKTMRVGRTRLTRVVRECLGRSPSQAVRDRVIAEAIKLTRYTSSPFKRISDDLGFPTQAYFARAFRNATGLSPSEFRRKGQEPFP